MINVNLLPYHLRPVKRTPILYLLGAAAMMLVLLGIAFKWAMNIQEVRSINADLESNRQALAALEPIVQEYNDLVQQKVDLGEQLETIRAIASDRIIWSRQLWNLNKLALDNMWYDEIKVQIKNVKEQEWVYDEKEKKRKLETVTNKKNFLIVEGYVVPGDNGEAQISPMMIQSQDPNEEFANLFQIQQHSLKDTEYEDTPVRNFTLEYLIGDFEESSEGEST